MDHTASTVKKNPRRARAGDKPCKQQTREDAVCQRVWGAMAGRCATLRSIHAALASCGWSSHGRSHLHGLPRRTRHWTSGRKSSQRTAPFVAASIAGQCSAGTLPRRIQLFTTCGPTWIKPASADCPPAILIASSKLSMRHYKHMLISNSTGGVWLCKQMFYI